MFTNQFGRVRPLRLFRGIRTPRGFTVAFRRFKGRYVGHAASVATDSTPKETQRPEPRMRRTGTDSLNENFRSLILNKSGPKWSPRFGTGPTRFKADETNAFATLDLRKAR
jgi:hypothetical protein